MKKINLLKQLCFLTIVSTVQLLACSDGYVDSFVKEGSYDFLDPVLIDEKEENPLYKLVSSSVYGYSERVSYFKQKEQELNLKEWEIYFNNRLSIAELEELFYDNEKTLKERFSPFKSKINNASFETYLNFLEKQSKFVRTLESDRDPLNFADEAEELFKKEKDPFLKLRYFFLLLRVQHYAGEYAPVIGDYERYSSSLKEQKSIVWEWIEALRAGALQHRGKDVASNLLYGKIFKNNKTNAYLGYYDFKIKNDTQWKNLLKKVKTPEEKALFYFLRALKWEGVPLLEHREIAKIAPTSIWFERLTYMIMQDFQLSSYRKNFDKTKHKKYVVASYESYLKKRTYFLETLHRLKEPSFFSNYAEVYVDLMHGEDSKIMSTKIETLYSISNQKQTPFVKILEYLKVLNQITDSGKNTQLFTKLERLFKEVPTERQGILSKYTSSYMASIYQNGSPEQKFADLSAQIHAWGSVEWLVDNIGAKDFEAYIENKSRTVYEKRLFKETMRLLKKDDVARFLTVLYTKEGNFVKANHYLQQIKKLNRYSEFNPFNVSLSGNNRKGKTEGYSQKKFLTTMLKIQKALELNPTSAMDHYLFANGLYNSSWFGNFPTSSWVAYSVRHFSEADGLQMVKKLNMAQKEYELALKYAKKKEFKAKISYQLLKIKLDKYFINEGSYSYSNNFFSPYRNKKLFRQNSNLEEAYEGYKKAYESSSYGAEIIRKCATFRYFK